MRKEASYAQRSRSFGRVRLGGRIVRRRHPDFRVWSIVFAALAGLRGCQWSGIFGKEAETGAWWSAVTCGCLLLFQVFVRVGGEVGG